MDFFYPNWINDFWRIQGLIHFGDRHYFESADKKFNKDQIVDFCNQKGIALFDTARKVCRLKDNADDNFLEIVEGTDVLDLLDCMTLCRTIVTTGGKASEELQDYFVRKEIVVKIPKVGEKCLVCLDNSEKEIVWWRMPSSSRAYPMKLEKKAEYYSRLWTEQ